MEQAKAEQAASLFEEMVRVLGEVRPDLLERLCASRAANATRSIDVSWGLADLAILTANGVDAVRAIVETVKYRPTDNASRRVLLVDVPLYLVSPGARNAILKTVEDPPPHALLVRRITPEDVR